MRLIHSLRRKCQRRRGLGKREGEMEGGLGERGKGGGCEKGEKGGGFGVRGEGRGKGREIFAPAMLQDTKGC